MRKIVGVEIVLFMVLGLGMGLVGEGLKRAEERVECDSKVRVWREDEGEVERGEALVGGDNVILGGVYVDCELVRDRRW